MLHGRLSDAQAAVLAAAGPEAVRLALLAPAHYRRCPSNTLQTGDVLPTQLGSFSRGSCEASRSKDTPVCKGAVAWTLQQSPKVKALMNEAILEGMSGWKGSTFEDVDGGHGRIETRRVWLTTKVQHPGRQLQRGSVPRSQGTWSGKPLAVAAARRQPAAPQSHQAKHQRPAQALRVVQ